MLFNKVFTNTVSGFEQGWWGAKYLLVLLVLVVNQEQAIVVQLLKVTACLGTVHPIEALPCPPLPGETYI